MNKSIYKVKLNKVLPGTSWYRVFFCDTNRGDIMLILMILVYVLNENHVIDLSSPKLIITEIVLMALFTVELKVAHHFIIKSTRFKKR